MQNSFPPKMHSEFFRHLLKQDFRQLQRPNDDLEIAGCQHTGHVAGDGRHVKDLAQEIVRGVEGHAEKGLNAVVTNTWTSRC
jgi:hypothetical protein